MWWIIIALTVSFLRPVGCPELPLGSTGTLTSSDHFAGRPVEVFQLAWTQSGSETYVVRLLDQGGGYLGATGCEIALSTSPS